MAKKDLRAVILFGGVQHVVADGDTVEARAGKDSDEKVVLAPLMTYETGNGESLQLGKPEIDGAKVTLTKVDERKGEKVQAIRYKAKKRVHKVRGHRDILSRYTVKL